MKNSKEIPRDLQVLEEHLYEMAAQEIRNGTIRDGLWLKAFADSSGDKPLAEANYAKLRVAQLLREAIEASRNEAGPSREEIREALEKADRSYMRPDKW
jgi:hypothetical protein